MSHITSNLVIAEYLGGKVIAEYPTKEKSKLVQFEIRNEYHKHYQCIHSESTLAYHKSWDWLMPVFEKLTDDLYGNLNPELDDIWEKWIGQQDSVFYSNNIEEAYSNVMGCIKEYYTYLNEKNSTSV